MSRSQPFHSNKSLARLVAVQVLFEAESSRRNIKDILAETASRPIATMLDSDEGEEAEYDHKHMKAVVDFAIQNQVKIDQNINAILAEGWKLAKIDSLLRAVFRSAGAEFLTGKTPRKVVITEYMGVVRAFQDERETLAFANAVLDRLGRALGAE